MEGENKNYRQITQSRHSRLWPALGTIYSQDVPLYTGELSIDLQCNYIVVSYYISVIGWNMSSMLVFFTKVFIIQYYHVNIIYLGSIPGLRKLVNMFFYHRNKNFSKIGIHGNGLNIMELANMCGKVKK